jgi:DNA-binding LytR/AlgR family response regulator
MKNYLIIEDEAPAARRLQRIVAELAPELNFLGSIESVESSIEYLSSNPAPDLIFLDIHLADGISFSIFDEVELKSSIIFVTAYDNYAINAFKLDSIDYLLKPINMEDVKQAIQRWKARNSNSLALDMQMLLSNIQNQKNYRSRILITKADKLIPISVTEIAWISADDKGLVLATVSNDKHAINFTLDELYSQLDPDLFFRVNRSIISHRNSIHQAEMHFNGKIKLQILPSPGNEVMVSRDKANSFKNWWGT